MKSKLNKFVRLERSLPAMAPIVKFSDAVFSAEEYGVHEGIGLTTALWRLRTKLLPQGLVRRVRTKRNGKLIAAWELVS